MTQVCTEIRINGPLEAVFDLTTTTRYWPRWHPATTAVAGVTDRPLALGDQVREYAVIGGRAQEGTWTVAEHQRPESVLLQIDGGRIQIGYTFENEGSDDDGSEGDGPTTRLRRVLTHRPEDFAGGATNTTALESYMSTQSEEALQRLKWLVEYQLHLEHNKRRALDILERMFNQRELSILDEGFTPDAGIHDPGMDFRGPAELRGGLEALLVAFPDFHFSVLEQLAEDDRVMIRYRGQGTQHAEFLGFAANGRAIDYTGIVLVRLEGQRIAEFWAQPDQLGLLKQLGAQVSPV